MRKALFSSIHIVAHCHTQGLSGQAAFAKEVAFLQNTEDCFFPLMGYDGELKACSCHETNIPSKRLTSSGR